MEIFIGIIEQGMIYAVMALGVYITYKILDFPDLTVDGSFPLGAAVTAILISNGVHPLLALLAATMAGALAGMVTGLIHVKAGVRDLLSGIISMTALYSVNLHIAGKANLSIMTEDTIFRNGLIQGLPEAVQPYTTMVVVCIIALLAKLVLDWYLRTKSGYLLRAVGDNATLVTSLAKDSGTVKIIGLAIANALVALGGAIMCQQQRFFEASMGTGTIVIGLASVIIGTNLFRRSRIQATTAVIIGSLLYKACVAGAIACGMRAIDMQLITAALFLVILILGKERKKKVKSHA